MQYVLLAAIAHIMQLKCSFCGPDKGAIYCHAYLIYIHRICIMCNYIHIEIYVYTECPGGNVPDFRRMFLKLKYIEITQNTYIQS